MRKRRIGTAKFFTLLLLLYHTSAKNAENYPYVKKIKIEGMTCPNCAVRIENAFNRIDGMWAKVDSSTGYGTIMMKQEKEDEELKRIVQRAGYTVVKGEL